MNIKIGTKTITKTSRPYFVADIAANHDGDINRAFKLIELAKESGADAAKFQNFKADTIVSKTAFEQMDGQLSHQKQWRKSVYDVYSDASLPDEWSERLKLKCDEVGMEYMTTPYDFHSVDHADKFVNCFKIGSGDITWIDIIEYIALKGKPVMLATGASDLTDVKRAYSAIEKHNKQIVLMQCNTNYTGDESNFKYVNLNVLKTYADLFPDAVLGLSDHTPGHVAVLGAVALGATVIEKHFTDDTGREGPDHKFSMMPITWSKMVTAANQLYNALGDGVKRVEQNENETVKVQRRALCYLKDMKKGESLSSDNLMPLRPCNGNCVAPYMAENFVGKIMARDVTVGAQLVGSDVL